MFHHDSRDYNVAASEAAAKARVKMEEIIHDGQEGAVKVIEQVSKTLINDTLAPANEMIFTAIKEGRVDLQIRGKNVEKDLSLHRNALVQALQTSNIPNPSKYIGLMDSNGEVGSDIMAYTLTNLFKNTKDKVHLVRSVNGQARGILSNRFKRYDSRPLLESFVSACQSIGAIPIQGYAEDTRTVLRAVLPMVFEPVPNEVMLFGIEWYNSDFGNGAHTLRLWNMRCWCTNLAMLTDILRQIHLGKRLDDSINYSNQTYELETKATASILNDTVLHCLGPDRVNAYCDQVKQAFETSIGHEDVTKILKKTLTKSEVEEVTQIYTSADIEMLPPGQNMLRLSNALSWAANLNEDTDKKFAYQKLAGSVLPEANIDVAPVVIDTQF